MTGSFEGGFEIIEDKLKQGVKVQFCQIFLLMWSLTQKYGTRIRKRLLAASRIKIQPVNTYPAAVGRQSEEEFAMRGKG